MFVLIISHGALICDVTGLLAYDVTGWQPANHSRQPEIELICSLRLAILYNEYILLECQLRAHLHLGSLSHM